jgi:hypothetical protein
MNGDLRVYDVLGLQGAKPMGEVLLQQILFNDAAAGMLCTGIQKLAQRFVLELLTEAGSMLYLPARGTQFMIKFRAGYLRTETDVFIAFNLALNDLELSLAAEELATDSPDEVYASATLDSVAITNGAASLHVTLMSQAGTSREVIMPISTTPGVVTPIATATPLAPVTTTVT